MTCPPMMIDINTECWKYITVSKQFKQQFHKPYDTYQLTNQCYILPSFKFNWFTNSLVFNVNAGIYIIMLNLNWIIEHVMYINDITAV